MNWKYIPCLGIYAFLQLFLNPSNSPFPIKIKRVPLTPWNLYKEYIYIYIYVIVCRMFKFPYTHEKGKHQDKWTNIYMWIILIYLFCLHPTPKTWNGLAGFLNNCKALDWRGLRRRRRSTLGRGTTCFKLGVSSLSHCQHKVLAAIWVLRWLAL